MKLHLVVVSLAMLLFAVSFNLFIPSSASAQGMTDACMHSASATIDSLEMCVKHAEEQGHIDSQNVAHTLLVKLDKAEDARADGHTEKAIWWLKAFIHEVKAQSGKHIQPMHVKHLTTHADMVIQAIQE